jgi:hypothetical protein
MFHQILLVPWNLIYYPINCAFMGRNFICPNKWIQYRRGVKNVGRMAYNCWSEESRMEYSSEQVRGLLDYRKGKEERLGWKETHLL